MRALACSAVLVAAVVLGACTGTQRPAIGAPSKAEAERLKIAEKAYRDNDPTYPALRDELAAAPTTAYWLTRLFVRDMFVVREGRPLGADQDLLRAAARIEDPVEVRAIQEITTLGGAAVPALVGDLLLHPQPQPRELGIELLGYVGNPAIPAVLDVARSGDARNRRAAARALGRLGESGEVLTALEALARDGDFTVRADAARGLAHGGIAAGDLLRRMAAGDPDAFVRRTAVRALSGHPGRDTANALVAYLARCEKDVDTQGYDAAQDCLQKLASARGPRTLEAWQKWAATLPATAR